LQLLRDLIPSLARVAVLASTPATDPFSGPFVENLRLAATRAGLRLEPILVSGPNEFESAFAATAKAGAQAVIIQPLFDPHRAILVELATKHRLALMSPSRETTAAGGAISVGDCAVLTPSPSHLVHYIRKRRTVTRVRARVDPCPYKRWPRRAKARGCRPPKLTAHQRRK
jgi:hypothetical protein